VAREPRLDEAIKLHQAGQFSKAREIYEILLVENPKNVNANQLLGLTLLDGADWQRGLALIEHAIELRPKEPLFRFNLGVGYLNHGDFQRAGENLRAAVELRPGYGEAWQALVNLQRYDSGSEELAQIVEQLSRDNSQEDRCFLFFAAAKICNDSGDYDQAFEYFATANSLRDTNWDAEKPRSTRRSMAQHFLKPEIERCVERGFLEASPIFIVGMPRSGSSLLEQILSSHSAVFGAGELTDIATIYKTITELVPDGPEFPAALSGLSDDIVRGYARSYIQRLASLSGDPGLRTVDKQLFNYFYIGFIHLLFPKARIIHARRNPLDTCLSCFFHNFHRPGLEFSFNLAELGGYYRNYELMMEHWQSVMPEDIHTVDYETLVSEPESTVRALLKFCDLPWEDGCLKFFETERYVSTSSVWQVRQSLYQSSVGRHRHYEKHLGPLREALAH
jgi:tetratricopeptide (TPR) repeat protein